MYPEQTYKNFSGCLRCCSLFKVLRSNGTESFGIAGRAGYFKNENEIIPMSLITCNGLFFIGSQLLVRMPVAVQNFTKITIVLDTGKIYT